MADNDTRMPAWSRTWLRLAAGALVLVCVTVVHVAPALGWSPLASLLPSYQLQAAKAAFVKAGNRVTPEIERLAQSVAAGAPLEAVPFYYKAIRIDDDGQESGVPALLDEAIRRDPRHYFARMWRARILYRTNRISQAVDEVLKVIGLNERGARDYVEAIVDVARDARNRPLVLKLVSQRPHWAQEFMQRVDVEIADDEFQLALASLSPDTLNRYLARLMDRGDYERALLIWQSSWSDEQRLAFSWPADPRFSGDNQGAPFGWGEDGRTASRGADGLYVFYTGRDTRKVVTQTMMLGPGYRYRLSAWSTGELKERGGWFQWSIACNGMNEALENMPVKVLTRTAAPLSTDFSVPPDCPVQNLSLSVLPGEYALSARMVVREVRIEELGRLPDVAESELQQPGEGR